VPNSALALLISTYYKNCFRIRYCT